MLKRMLCMLMAIVMLLGLSTGTEAAAAMKTRTVTIFKVEGNDVKMTKGTDKEFSAKDKLKLYDGYTVTTGKDSYCYLKLDDGSLLKMNQKSSIKVSKTWLSKLSISVLSGGILVDAETQKKGEEVEVRVGNSALAIRGTHFTAENESDGSAVYTMFEGAGQVDGHALPSGHIMDVYDNGGSTKQSAQSGQVHELEQLAINEKSSIFVLETVLDNTERFIENGTIAEKDISNLEKILEIKREELLNAKPALIIGKALYYELQSSGDYSGGINVDTITVDKSSLQNYLQVAYDAKKGVFINTNATNVDIGRQWATREVMDKLNDAIKVAEDLLSAVATVQQVRDATTNLAQEIINFLGTVNSNELGTKPLYVNTTSIETTISDAYSAKKGIFVNTEAINVENLRQWVTQADWNGINNAIAEAETALNSVASEDVINTVSELNKAIEAFNGAKQWGIGSEIDSDLSSSRDELETALSKAYAAKNAIRVNMTIMVMTRTLVNDDASKVDVGKQWVTSAEWEMINTAIKTAEDAFSMETTAEAVETAVQALDEAIEEFNSVKKDGARPLSLDKSILQTSLDNANAAKNQISVSTDAEEVFLGFEWVTPDEMRAINDAITAAEDAYMNIVATEQDVIDTANELDKAVKTLNDAKKQGNKALDPTELIYAILDAEDTLEMIDGIVYFIDTNKGRDTYWEYNWVTQEAFDALQTAIDAAWESLNTANSQMNIRHAIIELKSEIQRLHWSIRPGAKQHEEVETELKVWRNTRTNAEYSSFLNATEAAKDHDTLVLFGNTSISRLGTTYPVNLIINEGATLEIKDTGILAYLGELINNGTISNSGSLYVLGEQTLINNGILNNKNGATIIVVGAKNDKQRLFSEGILINNGTLNNEAGAKLEVQGSLTSGGIFNNKTDSSLILGKEESELLDGTAICKFVGTNGFVNDGNLVVGTDGIFDFSSDGVFKNNGLLIFSMNSEFAYNSPYGIFMNLGQFYWSSTGNADIKADMQMVGEEDAIFEVLLPIANVGKWDVSNIYDESDNQLTDSIPSSSYYWDKNADCWNNPLNKAALSYFILAAEAAKEGVEVSDNGDGVTPGNRWIPYPYMLLLDGFIDSAKDALINATTQSEIEEKINNLNNFVETFNNQIRTYDTNALIAAIAKAEDIKRNVSLKPDNPFNWLIVWVIEEAKELLGNMTIQEAINNKLIELNYAIEDYMKSALEESIEKAELTIGMTGVSDTEDGTDIPDILWVSSEDYASFESAIATAKGILLTEATHQELNDAYDAITNAIIVFREAVKSKLELDRSELETVIAKAEAVKAGVVVSVDGSDVPDGASWVEAFVMGLLEGEIEWAKDILASATVQQMIDDAVIDLNNRIEMFELCIQINSVLDKTELEAAIAEAEAIKAGLDPFDFLNDMILDIAITDAKDVLVTATSQQEINDALAELNEILKGFLDTSALEATIWEAETVKAGLDPFDFLNNMILDIAITDAKDVLATATSQQEINDALAELNDILKGFLDTSALEAAISEAEIIKAGLDPEDFSAMLLGISIESAKDVLATATSQQDIDVALATLENSLRSALSSALNVAVENAEFLMPIIEPSGTLLGPAIDNAKTVLITATSWQEIKAALDTLNDALLILLLG